MCVVVVVVLGDGVWTVKLANILHQYILHPNYSPHTTNTRLPPAQAKGMMVALKWVNDDCPQFGDHFYFSRPPLTFSPVFSRGSRGIRRRRVMDKIIFTLCLIATPFVCSTRNCCSVLRILPLPTFARACVFYTHFVFFFTSVFHIDFHYVFFDFFNLYITTDKECL